MKSSVKMIVTGLGSTLLRSDGSLSDFTVAVFEQCKRKGILTAVATSRFGIACRAINDCLSPDIVITDGGSLAKRRSRIIYRQPMNADTANRFISALLGAGISDIAVGLENGCLWNSRDIYKSTALSTAVYDDFREPLCDEVFVISVSGVNCSSVINKVALAFPELSLVSHRCGELYSFGSCKVSKEATVVSVAETCGIRLETVLAFGDDIEDVGMIKACGHGVAVGNALEAVKELADFICGTNDEDGVANYIAAKVL